MIKMVNQESMNINVTAQKNDSSEAARHECRFCGKSFKNGKALGGHRRSHFQAAKVKSLVSNNNNVNDDDKKKGVFYDDGSCNNGEKHTCYLCKKGFPSSHSLFGHMRTHPERPWRGVCSPLIHSHHHNNEHIYLDLVKQQKISLSSRCNGEIRFSNVSKASTSNNDDNNNNDEKRTCYICKKDFPSNHVLFGHMRIHSDRPWRGTRPLLHSHKPFSLSSWQMTGKRGRMTSEVYEAAEILMYMSSSSQNNNKNHFLPFNSMLVEPSSVDKVKDPNTEFEIQKSSDDVIAKENAIAKEDAPSGSKKLDFDLNKVPEDDNGDD